jgi:hypothetical protein
VAVRVVEQLKLSLGCCCLNPPSESIANPQSCVRTGISSRKETLRDIQESNIPKEHNFWFPSRPSALKHTAYATVNVANRSRAKFAIMVELLHVCSESKKGTP